MTRQSIVLARIAVTLCATIASAQTAPAGSVPADFVEHEMDGATMRAPPTWQPAPDAAADAPLSLFAPGNAAAAVFSVVPAAPALAREARRAETIARYGDQVRIAESRDVQLGSRTVGRTIYELQENAVTLRFVEYNFLDGDRRALLTLQTPAGSYKGFRPTFDQIAESVTFAPAAPMREIDASVPDTFVEHQFGGLPTSVRTPPDWSAETGKPAAVLSLRAPGGDAVGWLRPLVAGTIPLDAVLKGELGDVMRDHPDATIVSSARIKLAGRPFVLIVYDAKQGDTWMRTEDYLFVDDGGLAQVGFTCRAQAYAHWQPLFAQIAASGRNLRLGTSPPPSAAPKPPDAPTREKTAVVDGPKPPGSDPAADVARGAREAKRRDDEAAREAKRRDDEAAREARRRDDEAAIGRQRKRFQQARADYESRRADTATTQPADARPPEDDGVALARIAATWSNADRPPEPLLPAMKVGAGDLGTDRAADGTLTLRRGAALTSAERFKPPVTFRIVVRSDGNDVRLGYAFDQMIFNWEMRPTELRVDGGPAGGRHKPGAGTLTGDAWTGIELSVTPGELVVRVDGEERYRAAGDFSRVDAPLSISAHDGGLRVRSVDVSR